MGAVERLTWDRLLNGSNFSDERLSHHLGTDLNADDSRWLAESAKPAHRDVLPTVERNPPQTMAKCYKMTRSVFIRAQVKPILQAPDRLQNPRETKAFAIGNWAGKWWITTVQIGNNCAHTVPRDFGIYLSVIAEEYGFGRNQPVCE